MRDKNVYILRIYNKTQYFTTPRRVKKNMHRSSFWRLVILIWWPISNSAIRAKIPSPRSHMSSFHSVKAETVIYFSITFSNPTRLIFDKKPLISSLRGKNVVTINFKCNFTHQWSIASSPINYFTCLRCTNFWVLLQMCW